MAVNYLEQLVAEWYEFQGYFVRRNIRVGPRPNGGYNCELDVVAFNPQEGKLVHIEPSMDAHTWAVREQRFANKFLAGRTHIPALFAGVTLPETIEQIALLGYASTQNHTTVGGGRIMLVPELLVEILRKLRDLPILSGAVHEQFPILRTLQFVSEHRNPIRQVLFPELRANGPA